VLACSELNSLALVGTKVTDEGVLKLGSLTKLTSLYLPQEGVSAKTVAELKKANPDLSHVVRSPLR